MAKRAESNYPEEFHNWLKARKVSNRAIRRDPSLLEGYYREWRKSAAASRSGRRSLFPLPRVRVNWNRVAEQMRSMSEILETMQGLRSMVGVQQREKPDDQ